MENENRSFLARLNPANLRFTNKVLLLVLLIVLAIIVTYFSIGLNTLRKSLVKNSGDYLEEINYAKAEEIELNLDRIWNLMHESAGQEQLRTANSELSAGFKALADDKNDLFYDNKLVEISSALETYYTKTVAEHLPLNGQYIKRYIPLEKKTLVSQYLYIEQNPKPYGEKEQYFGGTDFSSYARAHSSYHPSLLDLMRKFNANDLYLIDPESGFVIYSVRKNIDYGTNLFEGNYRNTLLAESFLKALSSDHKTVNMTDYARYLPADDRPVTFMSIPIYSFNEIVGVLIVQYDNLFIDQVLFDESLQAGVNSLEYSIIGDDLKLRNNPAGFLSNREGYTRDLLKTSKRSKRDEVIKYSKSGSFALYLQFPDIYKDQLLNEGVMQIRDYTGTEVIACSQILNIEGVELCVVSKIDKRELLSPFSRQLMAYTLLTIFILLLTILILIKFGNSFSSRLNSLLEALKLLHSGEKSQKIEKGADDEVGATIDAYNGLRKRINSAEEFAIEMSEGNYRYEFDILSDRDSLGKSLNVLKATLIKSKEEYEERAKEDEIQNWINSGVAKFNDLLRENNDNIGLLAYSLIENLIEYLGAQIGGIFIIEGEKEESKTIDLIASYAYDRRKYTKKQQEAKEGLLGACYMEKKSIYLKEIPEDYIEIVSGLGQELPKSLYIVPLKVDENVLGMIEIASFSEFSTHQIELIDKLADSIAATFIGVRLNMKTASLLEESNSRAEEIAQQEEEMRQNLEEMQATQEELARLRQDDEKRTNEMQLIVDNTRATLKTLLDAIPGGYSLKDQNGIIHLINSEGAKYYGLSLDRVTGKTDHELLPAKIYEKEHKKDLLTLDEGEQQYTETLEVKGKSIEYKVTKKPFMMSEIGQQGILTLRYKVK